MTRRGSVLRGRTSRTARWIASAVLAVLFVAWGSGLFQSIPAVSVVPSTRAGLDTAAVDRFVNGYLRRSGLPGAAVVVVRDDHVDFATGYGHDSSGAPVSADTPMPMASLSKSVTALAVMQLVAADVLDLDRPVRQYLPEFQLADRRAEQITVRQLLNQTSGMTDATFAAMHVRPADSLRDAVAQLRPAGLASDPGTRWSYHNPNYQVAARLVEVVSHQDFAGYLRQHVFDPLGMPATVERDRTDQLSGIAPGYIDAWGRARSEAEPPWFVAGSGGVVTTARDLGQWLTVQTPKGRSNHPDVISATAIEEMQSPSDPRRRYGFGWGVNDAPGGPRVSHDGALFTFTAYQVVLPASGYAIAVLANRGYTLGPNDADAIGHGLIAIVGGQPASVGWPGWRVVDAALALATMAVLCWAVVAARRSRTWPTNRSRPVAGLVAGLAAAAIPAGALAALAAIGGDLFDQRDITLRQIGFVTPATVSLLGVTAWSALVVTALRTWWLLARRRTERHAAPIRPSDDPS